MWQLLQQNDANNDTEMCKENTPKKRREIIQDESVVEAQLAVTL